MDGKGGDDFFDKIFSNFFGSGDHKFDDHFRDMHKQMEGMFKHFGDIGTTINIGKTLCFRGQMNTRIKLSKFCVFSAVCR